MAYGLLTNPLLTDPTQSSLGLLGGGGGFASSPLMNFGLGLLAQSGPSLTPQSPWAAIGKAGQYATEAEQKALENALYRQKIAESVREQQGLAKLQEWIATPEGRTALQDQPFLGALAATGNPSVLQGLATSLSDPTLATRMAVANADLGTKVADNNQLLVQSRDAAAATEFLKSKGAAGEWALKHPGWTQWLSDTGTTVSGLTGVDPNLLLTELPGAKEAGVKPEDVKSIVQAAATVEGSRNRLLATGGIDPSIASADAETQLEAFRQAHERGLTVARAGGKLFDPANIPNPVYAWSPKANQNVAAQPPAVTPAAAPAPSPTAGSVGFQNGRMVPQPAPVYTPLPTNTTTPPAPVPTAAAPASQSPIIDALRSAKDAVSTYLGGEAQAAPTARKVPTLRYAPNGEALFRGWDEVKRAEGRGDLKGATGIWVNGMHYNWVP